MVPPGGRVRAGQVLPKWPRPRPSTVGGVRDYTLRVWSGVLLTRAQIHGEASLVVRHGQGPHPRLLQPGGRGRGSWDKDPDYQSTQKGGRKTPVGCLYARERSSGGDARPASRVSVGCRLGSVGGRWLAPVGVRRGQWGAARQPERAFGRCGLQQQLPPPAPPAPRGLGPRASRSSGLPPWSQGSWERGQGSAGGTRLSGRCWLSAAKHLAGVYVRWGSGCSLTAGMCVAGGGGRAYTMDGGLGATTVLRMHAQTHEEGFPAVRYGRG